MADRLVHCAVEIVLPARCRSNRSLSASVGYNSSTASIRHLIVALSAFMLDDQCVANVFGCCTRTKGHPVGITPNVMKCRPAPPYCGDRAVGDNLLISVRYAFSGRHRSVLVSAAGQSNRDNAWQQALSAGFCVRAVLSAAKRHRSDSCCIWRRVHRSPNAQWSRGSFKVYRRPGNLVDPALHLDLLGRQRRQSGGMMIVGVADLR